MTEYPRVRGLGLAEEAEEPGVAVPLAASVAQEQVAIVGIAAEVGHAAVAGHQDLVVRVDDPVELLLRAGVLGTEGELVLDADGLEAAHAGPHLLDLLARGVAADAEGDHLGLDRLHARDLAAEAEESGRVAGVGVGVLAGRNHLLDGLGRVDRDLEHAAFDLREIQLVHPGVRVRGRGRAFAQGAAEHVAKREPSIALHPCLRHLGIEISRQFRHDYRNQSSEVIGAKFLCHLCILLGLPFGKTTLRVYHGFVQDPMSQPCFSRYYCSSEAR